MPDDHMQVLSLGGGLQKSHPGPSCLQQQFFCASRWPKDGSASRRSPGGSRRV